MTESIPVEPVEDEKVPAEYTGADTEKPSDPVDEGATLADLDEGYGTDRE